MKSDIRTIPQNSNNKFYLRTTEYPSHGLESSTSKPLLKHKSPSKDKQNANQYLGHQDILFFLISFLFYFYLCVLDFVFFFLRKCLSVQYSWYQTYKTLSYSFMSVLITGVFHHTNLPESHMLST